MPEVATAPGAPRPVTPLGIAAALLASVEDRLAGGAGVADVGADLARARELVAGLDPYVESCTPAESPALAALRRRTAEVDWRRHEGVYVEQEMLSGHVEGAVLQMLVRASGARRVLEVGMFTGYSALAMAEALPPGGDVVACELDPAVADVARACFAASPRGDDILVAVGPAADTLDRLATEGQVFDLVFVDADKGGYAGYVDAVLGTDGRPGLLAPEGLLLLDNTLLQGEPWTSAPSTTNGQAIADLNERLAADPRLVQVVLPLRDGLTVARRT